MMWRICLTFLSLLLTSSFALAADGERLFSSGMVDIDVTRLNGATQYGWDGAWRIGGDYDKLVARSRGEGARQLDLLSAQLLYSRYLAPFWDVQFGARYDYRPSARWRGVVAVEGLAPYGIETLLSLYGGGNERVAGEVELSWPLQMTQKMVFEPYVNGEWALRQNFGVSRGAGIGPIDGGLLLRYEFNRHVALYADLYVATHVGSTRTLVRRSGEKITRSGVKLGLRLFNW